MCWENEAFKFYGLPFVKNQKKTSLTLRDTLENSKIHQKPKFILQAPSMMLNCHTKNEVKRSSCSGDTFC